VLAGVEVDILEDGRLDLDSDTLAGLDWVVASVHSHFELSKTAMTKRLIKAVRSGVIHCIGHPAGRLIGRRNPIDADWDEVFAACAECGVRLEINAQPDRLDLRDNYCQQAKEAGVGFVVDTDAHKLGDLEFMDLGVGVARRGWLERGDVLNTLPAAQLKKAIRKRR
jgi:DNA polymerase (family 10)